jgi:hypothetical protein
MFRFGPVCDDGCRQVMARPTVRSRSYDLAAGTVGLGAPLNSCSSISRQI